jgi:prepilin-type N-terminal cleavage/methylation domain-containing protein
MAVLLVCVCVPLAHGRSVSTDSTPPTVVVLPTPEQPSDAAVTVRARVLDPSGIDRVVLWARGDTDDKFRSFVMKPEPDERFVASIPFWASRGQRIAYYIEAHDAVGNGPRYSGNPRAPFLMRLTRPLGKISSSSIEWSRWAAIGWVTFLFAACVLVDRKAAREKGRQQVISALDRLPLDRQRSASLPPLETPEQATAEMFWFGLLSPLGDMNVQQQRQALSRLCMRTHHHPVEGKRIFDRMTLSHHLEWVRRADLEQLRNRWSAVNVDAIEELISERLGFRMSDPVTAPRQAGMTLPEVLVVVALIAVALGIALVRFDGTAPALQTAGELTEGMLQHTRARAMAKTTPHRLRPISSTTLVVESGASCSAGPWTLEPDLQLELPDGVTVSDTTWDVCFVSRGTSTQNLVITLNDYDGGSRQLEVLLGGAVQWLP